MGDRRPRPGTRTGRGAQPGLAPGTGGVGCVPRRRRRARARLARGPARGPAGRGPPGRRQPGPDRGAAAVRPAPDRLGAQRPRPRGRAVGHRRPRLPASRAGGGRWVRRALRACLPRGLRPGPARVRGGVDDRARPSAGPSPGGPGAGRGVASQAGRQRGRRADGRPARPGLARARGGAGGPSRSPPRGGGGGRGGRRGVLAGRRSVAALGLAGWAAGTAELAWARIAPGPRTAGEVATMVWTSAAMPFAAAGWWLAGRRRARGASSLTPRPAAVLFDRDGTLVVDVPYNGDPDRVALRPGAREAVERLRRAGIPTGVVSNQSGIARGLLTEREMHAVNARVEDLLGPLGPWTYCPHGPEDGCGCRKPACRAGAARRRRARRRAARLRGDRRHRRGRRGGPRRGARGILVTPRTRPEEVEAAEEVASRPRARGRAGTGGAP